MEKKTEEQRIKEMELHEFVSNPIGFIKGFLSRRKAANSALRLAKSQNESAITLCAERAVAYNKLFNAACEAFKGTPEEFMALLEGHEA